MTRTEQRTKTTAEKVAAIARILSTCDEAERRRVVRAIEALYEEGAA